VTAAGDSFSASDDDVDDETASATKPVAAMKLKGTGPITPDPSSSPRMIKATGLRKKGAVASTLKKISATHKAAGPSKRSTF
jgi:hypothetical protein